MRITVTKSGFVVFQIALVVGALAHPGYCSDDKKRAKAYRDINAIGHRVIGYPTGVENWYSLRKEKEIATQVSASFEKTYPILHDSMSESYLERLVQVIARNSDAQLPVSFRIIDSDDSYALTFPGGYQYITRGLLLQLQNEGELAAAIARGIAHTALRSAMGEFTRTQRMYIASVPPVFAWPGGIPTNGTAASPLNVPLTLHHFRMKDESAADYIGVQYLYKSEYAPECFISFIQKAWPASARTPEGYSPFPPLPERLAALQKEIKEILPKQSGAITDTEDFRSFREHLLGLVPPPQSSPKQPTLIRHDSQETN